MMEIVRYTELKNTKRHNLADVIPLEKPYTLLIEPSSSCNFRCRMCFQSAAQEKFKDKRHAMDMGLFRRVIAQAQEWSGERFKVLKLCIYGEPFTNPHFTEMLRLAHEADIADRIETTSNASLLTEEICRGLVRGGLDYLRVSIYSAIPQKHLEITDSNVPMQRVHDNLAMLQRIKREMGSERPFIACKMLNTFDEAENQIFRDAYADVADEIYIDEPHSWVEIDGEQFIDRLYGDDMAKVERKMTGRAACPMPFTTLAVRSDGAVSPCCNDWYGGTNLSNVQEETLAEIWNGWKLYDFQVMQLEKRNHENISCRGCSVYKSAHYTRDDIDDVSVTQLHRPNGEERHA